MIDYHTALTSESIKRQQLTVTSSDEFKKDVSVRNDHLSYTTCVDVWMLPCGVPCQAIPLRNGNHREIVVLPMFTELWFQEARSKTYKEHSIWAVCKILSFLLSNAAREKGAKFPRYPFVVVLDPAVKPRDGKPMTVYTTDPRVHLTGVQNVAPVRVTNHTEMVACLNYGLETNQTLRLVREVEGTKERWFWEPVSYLTALRLQSVHYDNEGRISAELYGDVDGLIVAPVVHKVAADFADLLSSNLDEYLDTMLLLRFAVRDSTAVLTEDVIASGSLCGRYDTNVSFGPQNRMLTI